KKSKEVLRRLKFDNETIDLLKVIIKHHDERHEFLQGNKKRRGMRRLINRVGKENMLYLFMLQKADVMSQSDYYQKEKLEKIEEAEQLFLEIKKENEPVDIEDLEISGKEIIELGIKQGPMIGEILNDLLERVLDDPEINKREKLEKIVREMLTEKR
ncbi:MAG: polynucleotide adenylyltransferase, partial [Lachnospiraceae bacterium]|nr:polynucleotide adenylyltransferase [Lachnospiraceae bacterium]